MSDYGKYLDTFDTTECESLWKILNAEDHPSKAHIIVQCGDESRGLIQTIYGDTTPSAIDHFITLVNRAINELISDKFRGVKKSDCLPPWALSESSDLIIGLLAHLYHLEEDAFFLYKNRYSTSLLRLIPLFEPISQSLWPSYYRQYKTLYEIINMKRNLEEQALHNKRRKGK